MNMNMNRYQFQGRIKYQRKEEIDPVLPPPSAPAPLQHEVSKETLSVLANIITKVLPLVQSGGKDQSKANYICSLNILRSALKVLNVNIYQYSLLKKKFVLSEELLAKIRSHLEALQSLDVVENSHELDLKSLVKLIKRSASEAFASAISLFYPTPLGKMRYTINNVLNAGPDDSVGVAGPFKDMIKELSGTDGENALDGINVEVDRLFDALDGNSSSKVLVSTAVSMADMLFNSIYSEIASQQDTEAKESKTAPNSNFSVILPKYVYQFFIYFNKRYLESAAEATKSIPDEIKKLCGDDINGTVDAKTRGLIREIYLKFVKSITGSSHFIRYLHALYLVSAPDRAELSVAWVPALQNLLGHLAELRRYKQSVNFKPVDEIIKYLIQVSGQLLFCQLRGKAVSADEKANAKWLKATIFTGGLATHSEEKVRPVAEDEFVLPEALHEFLKERCENKSYQRRNLKSVRELTIQVRLKAFAVFLKHTNKQELALEIGAELAKDKGTAVEAYPNQLRTFTDTWGVLKSLQNFIVSIHARGGDAKAAGALVLSRLEFLNSLSPAMSEEEHNHEDEIPQLTKMNSLEIMRSENDHAGGTNNTT